MNPDELVRYVVEVAHEKKAHGVLALDVRGLTIVADYFVITSTRSEIAMRALLRATHERVLARSGVKPRHVEGTAAGGWIIIDYGDVIIHIFDDETRSFYDLEGLWGDAPEVTGYE